MSPWVGASRSWTTVTPGIATTPGVNAFSTPPALPHVPVVWANAVELWAAVMPHARVPTSVKVMLLPAARGVVRVPKAPSTAPAPALAESVRPAPAASTVSETKVTFMGSVSLMTRFDSGPFVAGLLTTMV